MIVICEKCGLRYDDVKYYTFCPHDGIDGICREHDLPFQQCKDLTHRNAR